MGSLTQCSLKQSWTMKLLAIALVGLASAELGEILSSKQEATQLFREKRGLFGSKCNNQLGAPKCWGELSEEVWQPRGPFRQGKNLVPSKEGKPFYWCIKRCRAKDQFADLTGGAWEEVREDNKDREFTPACPQCCDKVPKSLNTKEHEKIWSKIVEACPKLAEDATSANVSTQPPTTTTDDSPTSNAPVTTTPTPNGSTGTP